MSQRDALLRGAKQCLMDKGYNRTTARDIATASGAHLASIGYHFGSKDRLMNLAAFELSSEWGDTLEGVVRTSGGDPAERLGTLLESLVDALPSSRDLLTANLAALAEAPFDEALREELAKGFGEARRSLAALVLGTDSVEEGSRSERGLGALAHALTTGLAVQALIDPDSLPAPGEAAAAVQALRES